MMAKNVVVPRALSTAVNTGLYWQGAKSTCRGKDQTTTCDSIGSTRYLMYAIRTAAAPRVRG
jgi:hypothetical protein